MKTGTKDSDNGDDLYCVYDLNFNSPLPKVRPSEKYNAARKEARERSSSQRKRLQNNSIMSLDASATVEADSRSSFNPFESLNLEKNSSFSINSLALIPTPKSKGKKNSKLSSRGNSLQKNKTIKSKLAKRKALEEYLKLRKAEHNQEEDEKFYDAYESQNIARVVKNHKNKNLTRKKKKKKRGSKIEDMISAIQTNLAIVDSNLNLVPLPIKISQNKRYQPQQNPNISISRMLDKRKSVRSTGGESGMEYGAQKGAIGKIRSIVKKAPFEKRIMTDTEAASSPREKAR